MTATASITTQHGISVSLTVPAGRYRIIRRASLHQIRPHRALGLAQTQKSGFWTNLQTWLLHPNAQQLHARRQSEAALATEYEKQSLKRLFLHFP